MNIIEKSKQINKTLRDAGWTTMESSLDGLNLEGETNEGATNVCTLLLAERMPENDPPDDLDTILLFIEEGQRKAKECPN